MQAFCTREGCALRIPTPTFADRNALCVAEGAFAPRIVGVYGCSRIRSATYTSIEASAPGQILWLVYDDASGELVAVLERYPSPRCIAGPSVLNLGNLSCAGIGFGCAVTH